MERVVFGICLCSRDYERRRASREFLADNKEEIVFLFAGRHQVFLIYQGVSSCRSHRGVLRVYGDSERPIERRIVSKMTGGVFGHLWVGVNQELGSRKARAPDRCCLATPNRFET
jgi:hypothetical protein